MTPTHFEFLSTCDKGQTPIIRFNYQDLIEIFEESKREIVNKNRELANSK